MCRVGLEVLWRDGLEFVSEKARSVMSFFKVTHLPRLATPTSHSAVPAAVKPRHHKLYVKLHCRNVLVEPRRPLLHHREDFLSSCNIRN